MPSFVPGLPKTRAALANARRAHEGQLRKMGGSPFIEHPREVASLLYCAAAPDHVIAAGALHDVIEKTDVDAQDLRERFGSRVAGLVLAVSEDEDIRSYARRKAALRAQAALAGEEALAVLAADKVSKARANPPVFRATTLALSVAAQNGGGGGERDVGYGLELA
jgi:(p)ppGpp synthase/HD superfamily hydrolase